MILKSVIDSEWRSSVRWQTFQPLLRINREALLEPKALRRAPTARASRGVWGHAGLRSLRNTGCSMETGQDIKDRKV